MTWKIGDVKITPIVEIEAGGVIQQIIQNATKEEILKIPWLIPHFADKNGNLRAVVQAFVIDTKNMRMIVDTCVGNEKPRKEIAAWDNLKTGFLERLNAEGYKPDKINIVLCTHLHFDHVGWNTMRVGDKLIPTFPHARYLFAEKEYNYWKDYPEPEMKDDFSGINDSVLPILNAGLAELVPTDHSISDEISLIHTPGHTPGHVSVLISSKGKQAVITGDAVHHPCQIAHPDWESFDTNKERAKLSRRALFEQFVDTQTLIIGSHFSAPTAGFLRRDGKDFRLMI